MATHNKPFPVQAGSNLPATEKGIVCIKHVDPSHQIQGCLIKYEYDKAIYKQRNVIERMLCRFKDWRQIAMRYELNIKNFLPLSLSPLP